MVNGNSPGLGVGVNFLTRMKLESFEARCTHNLSFKNVMMKKFVQTAIYAIGQAYAEISIVYALRHPIQQQRSVEERIRGVGVGIDFMECNTVRM